MQHPQSSVELQGATPAHSSLKRSSTPGSGSRRTPSSYRSSRLMRGCGLYPQEDGRLWAWILLWALAAPGACGLAADLEELIVQLHNHYRGQVFPSAMAMMPLKWDASLQVLAGSHVAKCTWQHNPLLTDTGENLFVTEGELDVRVGLEQWFMEHLYYNYDNNSCPEDKMCGHYTQMVWSDSHRVGCEVHSCDVMKGLEIGPSQFLVCNYYPAGNYEDQRPYEEGDWCSRCPEDLQKCQNHLCVPVEEEGEDDEDPTDEPLDIGSSPSSWTEAPPPTPSQDTPPVSHSSPEQVDLPALTAGVEEVETGEGETTEEALKEEEQKEEKQKEETGERDTVEEAPKDMEQKEETGEQEQKEEPKEKPKQEKALIEMQREKKIPREETSRATSFCSYGNFLLLGLVGALALRL